MLADEETSYGLRSRDPQDVLVCIARPHQGSYHAIPSHRTTGGLPIQLGQGHVQGVLVPAALRPERRFSNCPLHPTICVWNISCHAS